MIMGLSVDKIFCHLIKIGDNIVFNILYITIEWLKTSKKVDNKTEATV
jgi:hypothetical protein